jgi:hypothetical protein
MANLKAIAELAYRALFPEPREKTAITLEEFIATARTEYAASMWIYRMEQIAAEGWFDMNSGLLSEVEKEVVNNKIDISDLNYLNGLPGDLWLQNIGGLQCECNYIKTTINLSQLLCEDDSGSDSDHPYYVQGKSIVFPKGTHSKKLTIIYANTGGDLDEDVIEVDDYVASKVRIKLMQLYGGKMPVDETNNQSSNT